jgi:carbon starvation protein
MLQDLLGHAWKPLGTVSGYPGVSLTSALVVAGWGWFLYQGVIDPLGGINSLWPLFGIANQLLAAIALCVGTTLLIKLHKARYAFITLVPLAWVAVVTFTAGVMKVFDPSPKIGFLAHRDSLAAKLASGAIPADKIADTMAIMRNDLINAGVASLFLLMTGLILVLSIIQWVRILQGRGLPLAESPVEYHGEAREVVA